MAQSFSEIANLIWSVAELLRGDYKQADYGAEGVTVLRGCGATRREKRALSNVVALVTFILTSSVCTALALPFMGPVKERTSVGPAFVRITSIAVAVMVWRMTLTKAVYYRRS